jgi:hypothetical protein
MWRAAAFPVWSFTRRILSILQLEGGVHLMFNERERATLLAALLFWREEITDNGNTSAGPYLKSVGREGATPLAVDEIQRLARRIRRWH